MLHIFSNFSMYLWTEVEIIRKSCLLKARNHTPLSTWAFKRWKFTTYLFMGPYICTVQDISTVFTSTALMSIICMYLLFLYAIYNDMRKPYMIRIWSVYDPYMIRMCVSICVFGVCLHKQELHESIIGQDEAVGSVSRALRRARAGLRNPARPMAGSGASGLQIR